MEVAMDKVKVLSRKERLVARAEDAGLTFDTWSPGDGMTRYRFFDGTARDSDYFGGHGDEVQTCLGLREAEVWLRGYVAGKHAGRRGAR